MVDLMATRWLDRGSGLVIEAVVSGERFVFAVRRPGGECLNRQGGFEVEPSPSNRDQAFLDRCRWSDFGEAARALEKAAEK